MQVFTTRKVITLLELEVHSLSYLGLFSVNIPVFLTRSNKIVESSKANNKHVKSANNNYQVHS